MITLKKSKRLLKSSLFLQFTLLVIGVALVSLFISLGIYRENIRNLLAAEVENKATLFLSGLEPSIGRFVNGRETVHMTELMDHKADFLKEYLTFTIVRMAVLNLDGRIIDHTIPDRIGQYHINEEFRQALTGGRPLVTREMKVMRLEPGSLEIPVIKIYYPVHGPGGNVMAVIMMDLDVRRTMKTIRNEYGRFNRRVVTGFALTTVLMVISILLLLKRRIIDPVAAVARASGNVAKGRMQQLSVPRGQDEMARLIHSFNQMVEGLQQRDQMRLSLELAKEVQQNLLPKKDPLIKGLDISGKSIYCDSTGGDYFDYLYDDHPDCNGQLLVVVGDVSDHGIQSALLMATARSALHQCWMHAESLALILADMNQQLASDVEDSGYFMTMFLIQIDSIQRCVRWANAGHDPALVYNRHTDAFDELEGRGLALGIDTSVVYKQWQRETAQGQVFIVGTDGIWEARRADGALYGKDRLKAVVRKNGAAPARQIVAEIIDDVERFMARPLEDDVTVTVIKIDD